jgi:uncharacterized membrane protein
VSPSPFDASIKRTPTVNPQDGLASALTRNIAALAQRRRSDEAREGADQKVARAVTGFAGSMWFVWLHAAVVACGWR